MNHFKNDVFYMQNYLNLLWQSMICMENDCLHTVKVHNFLISQTNFPLATLKQKKIKTSDTQKMKFDKLDSYSQWQPRIERSFELDILLKNSCMKQKKIDKDQRILPLTAIAIDCKLWGF